MIIQAEKHQIIFQKLAKIKCSTGCLNNINYLAFNYGLYCTSCLAKIANLNQQDFINIQTLSQVLANLSDQYIKNTKGQLSQLNIFKGQIQTLKSKVQKQRDNLAYDVKTVKTKATSISQELYIKCLKQNQNLAMESLFQPDLSVTSIVNESQLLAQNLKNLTIQESQQNQINYIFKQSDKKPQKVNSDVKKKLKNIKKQLQAIKNQTMAIIDNFKEQTKS